jgi:hypothetical protein
MAVTHRVADFRKADCPSFDLDEKIQQLEALVDPKRITDKPIANHTVVITLRGKKQLYQADHSVAGYSAIALQFAYQVKAARKAGDVDAVMRRMFGFTRAYLAVENFQIFGAIGTEALAYMKRQQPGRARGGKGTLRWTPKIDKWVHEIFEKDDLSNVKDDPAANHIACRLLTEKGVEFSISRIKSWLKSFKR